MIQIRLSHPFPHPQPSLFPPPQQQSKIKRSRQLLFPPKQDEPQDPPQPVAAKSLMLKPPKDLFTVYSILGIIKCEKIRQYTFFNICGIICNECRRQEKRRNQMKRIDFERIFDNIRRNQTMVHCITNYVTINDVANMILAIGASPIMADDWMEVREITAAEEKQRIARLILESLPDWFGIPEAREEYIEKSVKQPFFAAFDGENAVGFLYLAETGRDTAELYVMGVLKEYHRRGVGKMLFAAAKQRAKELGYSFLQVKTVQMGKYPEYDATNRFYLALGFGEFEVFPTLWDEWNPCQIYVMSLK